MQEGRLDGRRGSGACIQRQRSGRSIAAVVFDQAVEDDGSRQPGAPRPGPVELPQHVLAGKGTVVQAVPRDRPGAKVLQWEKDTRDGKTIFEVGIRDGEKELTLVYSDAGVLMETEEGIPVAQLPPAVTDAVKRLYPGATVVEADKVTRPDRVLFEVKIKGTRVMEILLTEAGELMTLPP